MITWHQLVQQKLDLPWLPLRERNVPFGLALRVPGEGGDNADWTVDSLEETTRDHWVLRAHTARGLEAEWHARFFADTRSMECWGDIVNRGTETLKHIFELQPLDMMFAITPEVGLPWVRSFNGARHVPRSFPAFDFAHLDQQLMRVPPPHDYPYDINCAGTGRSSDAHLPVLILTDAQQKRGMSAFIEWSGMWLMRWWLRTGGAEKPYAPDSSLRFMAVITGLDLHLQPGDSVPLPRVLFSAFDGDLDAGCNTIRRHVRRHVMPQLDGREVLPPTSFNHWFAFENNYTADLLKPAVVASAAAGLEYFCVDGGWFEKGFRDGIGNWSEGAKERFPEGIKPFSEYVRSQGLKYGTWFEPEWAHKDSELYLAHPEWFWQTPFKPLSDQSDYHLMNFGMSEVREWWLQRFIRAYEEWGVRWVRWDYNAEPRGNWDHELASGEIGRRQIDHITGLYATLDSIMEACPDLFIEQCASGGYRIDLGTVRRGHSFWMNDHTVNSDIIRFMQQGLNLILPGNYQNTNICQGRHDFTDYDFLSHGAGGFGYSGRLWEAPEADFARYQAAVARFKEYRPVLLGDYHRPTGQPTRYDEYSKVVFQDEGQELTLEYNIPGEKRAARSELVRSAARR
jgi:hypothetical protein